MVGLKVYIVQNVNDYDDVFTELYEKYNTTSNMAPELKLIFMNLLRECFYVSLNKYYV